MKKTDTNVGVRAECAHCACVIMINIMIRFTKPTKFQNSIKHGPVMDDVSFDDQNLIKNKIIILMNKSKSKKKPKFNYESLLLFMNL